MAQECRKACYRRLHDPAFHQRYFVGNGLDVGAGEDSLSKYAFFFPRITTVRDWNHSDGDGTDLEGELANWYDFVHSSHSLEHMRDPYTALKRWLEVVKPGGHVIVTVPDFQMYEHHRWPSENGEHTHAFTMGPTQHRVLHPWDYWDWRVNVLDLARYFEEEAVPVKIERLESTFDWNADPLLDQTCFGSGAAEACIEFVLRKI